MIKIDSYTLSQELLEPLYEIAASLPDEYTHGNESNAVSWVENQTRQLPTPLLEAFEPVVSTIENSDAVVLKGIELPEMASTPERYLPVDVADVSQFDVPQLCIAALVGASYGTSHVRGGRIIADIIPRRGFESKPDSAFGSKELFDFHVDGVVQPDTMADYFSLNCLRNKLRTPTLVSNVESADLTNEEFDLLQQPVFTLRYGGADDTKAVRTKTSIIDTTTRSKPSYNYYGELKAVYDGANVEQYAGALNSFHEALNKNAVPIVLEPGDIAMINNRTVLHARPPFSITAVPTAQSRWLRRVHIATRPTLVKKIGETPSRILRSTYV